MYSILLIIIYIAFISLGLPDSVLGSAWPCMYSELMVPVSYAGIVSMIISACTIVSSMNINRVVARLGTGLMTAISVAMTAGGLLGFAGSNSFATLCLWAIPYGLGAGCVDAALNNFVALHYKSKHMSWLHCFWGVGATAGPYIMGFCLADGMRWTKGYLIIGIVQAVLSVMLFVSLPLWKNKDMKQVDETGELKVLTVREILNMKGAKNVLIAFFCYCSFESTAGLWASSYMTIHCGINVQTAARWAALFYMGITVGRFLSGFISDKFGDKNMTRLGQGIAFFGGLILFMFKTPECVLAGLLLFGLGCAPIYPSMLHATPEHFGAENSQALMGVQMGFAYIGLTIMPTIFGWIADYISIGFYAGYLLLFLVIQIVFTENLNRSHGNFISGTGISTTTADKT
ncbi:MAG: MFS transporter [Lachnospiraceae bacterium]|nr:MFS transporter [Lachnospiraceae bacterium]